MNSQAILLLPAASALGCFLLGQVFTLLAWKNGEVSVTTPLAVLV